MIDSMRPPEPFPWLCPRCGQETVNPITIVYKSTKQYEGRTYEIEAPGVVVFECGEQLFNNEAGDRIGQAFRAALGLLQPEEILEGREALGLSPQDFADALGFAEELISRWETGALVQPRHADKFIRAYFASPDTRQLLALVGNSPGSGKVAGDEEPAQSSANERPPR